MIKFPSEVSRTVIFEPAVMFTPVINPVKAPEVMKPTIEDVVAYPVKAPAVMKPTKAPAVVNPVKAPEVMKPTIEDVVAYPVRFGGV